MDILSLDLTTISGGSILILLAILTFAFVLYRASPIGQDTVEAYKGLLEVEKQKLANAEADAATRFAQVEQLTADLNATRVELARCEERPSTDELARAIKMMQEGFTSHRDDLLHTQNRILAHLETTTEAIKSMEQTLTLVAERLRSDAERRREQEG